jgi:hypothetical protein
MTPREEWEEIKSRMKSEVSIDGCYKNILDADTLFLSLFERVEKAERINKANQELVDQREAERSAAQKELAVMERAHCIAVHDVANTMFGLGGNEKVETTICEANVAQARRELEGK